MGLADEMPDFMPKPDIHANVTGGVMTFTSASKLVNVNDFKWGEPPQIIGNVYKNGTLAATISINTSTGDMAIASVAVSTGDHIEIRLDAVGPMAWPWNQSFGFRRSCFFDVPAGTSTTDFDATTNVMPVPALDFAFGWDNNDKFKVGVKVIGADGAGQNYTLYTRRDGAQQETSTTISTSDTTNAQSLTAAFGKSDIGMQFEFEMWLKSGTGATRVEDRFHAMFTDKTQVANYPPGFPGSCLLQQTKDAGKLKVDAPR